MACSWPSARRSSPLGPPDSFPHALSAPRQAQNPKLHSLVDACVSTLLIWVLLLLNFWPLIILRFLAITLICLSFPIIVISSGIIIQKDCSAILQEINVVFLLFTILTHFGSFLAFCAWNFCARLSQEAAFCS